MNFWAIKHKGKHTWGNHCFGVTEYNSRDGEHFLVKLVFFRKKDAQAYLKKIDTGFLEIVKLTSEDK